MATPSDKTMFEIYREADYGRQYRVVYFTELDEHNKEAEINRAMSGEHFYDGFLTDLHKDEGKRRIADIVKRLNDGETIDSAEVEKTLSGMMG
ncbi:hypothetical protein B7486_20010 [cyanobacterium TDX16]|nr:hypothetical protein B7486_20010 [cyanobacterium TDX16]